MLNRLGRRVRLFWFGTFLLLTAGGAHTLWRGHERREQRARTAAMLARIPNKVLWVWERPEDLRAIDAANTGVAVLEETVYLGAYPHAYPGSGVNAIPRREPVILPAGVRRIAVVRLEAAQGFRGDAKTAGAAARELLRVAREPGIVDFEIDFDATRSQRGFYRSLLDRVRHGMPADLPLSITALASWCSNDDWIADLPVDEAIPMYFRMEPGRRQAANEPEYRVMEPLCAGSVGVSTHEAWPENIGNRRVYVFADKGWAKDLALLDVTEPEIKKTGLEGAR